MNIDQIRNALPNSSIWDDEIKGLQVKVSATGKKTFFFYYRTKAGQQRRPKLGEFGSITLAEAKKAARKLRERIIAGEDPKGDWDESKAEYTVKDMYDITLAEYWNKARFINSDWKRHVTGAWDNHLKPTFANYKLSEVTPTIIKKWHSSLERTPYAANRSKEVLSRIFKYAEELGYRNQHTNPCVLVKSFQEKKRKRYATPEEVKHLGQILMRKFETHPREVTFLYLLLTTGSRPKAIADATPSQLQAFEKNGVKYGILTFKGKTSEKTGEEEVVVIPPQGMAMLEKIPRIPGGTLTNCRMPSKLWKKIRSEMGCDDLWARDLRRTFATIGLSSGINVGTISELLNHRSTQTTKIYAKLMDAERVIAATSIANSVEALIG